MDNDGAIVKGVCSEPIEKAEKFKTSTIKTKVVLGEYKLEYRVYKSKEEAELDRKKVAESFYKRAKQAKAHIHEANRLGWPDTPEAIERLIAQMGEDEQLVCYCGRFIKRWNGWRFQFPATVDVIGAIENGEGVRELKFVEDEES